MDKIRKFAGIVLGSGAREYIAGQIGLRGFDWVEDYLRDQKIRGEIQSLLGEIAEINKAPMHTDELKAAFLARVDSLNQFRLKQVKHNLELVQKHEMHLLNERHIDGAKLLGSTFAPFLMAFSEQDMDFLFDDLPEGMKAKDKEAAIHRRREQIAALEDKIARELSPQSRWWHRPDGNPEPYPNGCRWRVYAEVWRQVAARFEGAVDLDGGQLDDGPAYAAYFALGLNKAAKVHPLREAFK